MFGRKKGVMLLSLIVQLVIRHAQMFERSELTNTQHNLLMYDV